MAMASEPFTKLQLCTYNIRGYNSTKFSYVTDLLQRFTIVMLQEHWMNDTQLQSFSNMFPGYCVHSVSAMDITTIVRGRPKGGVLIIYPDTYGSNAKLVHTTSNRLCALSLKFDCFIVYLFCIYMPCDINEIDNLNEFNSILNEISLLCLKYDVENVCIAGDMNTDLSRLNSWHTQSIKQFVEQEDMYCVINNSCADVDYTYINAFTNAYNIISLYQQA